MGMAIRSAYSLGLHVFNEDSLATTMERGMLTSTWWSLYLLDRTLSIITGRPSNILDSCCSVPLPNGLSDCSVPDGVEIGCQVAKEDKIAISPHSLLFLPKNGIKVSSQRPAGLRPTSMNSCTYFNATIQLSAISQDILTSLYSVVSTIRSPSAVHLDMVQLNLRVDRWVMSLPRELDPSSLSASPRPTSIRERMLLTFQLCSTRMLLARPYLHDPRQLGERANSDLVDRMINSGIAAAKTIVNMLPDEPNPIFIYHQGPWWCIVHHMTQATSILLLGIMYASPKLQENLGLLWYVKKALRWLYSMQDPLAGRAYRLALNSFEIVASHYLPDIYN
jgi:hypothetical protein